jgi:hypothetical protein
MLRPFPNHIQLGTRNAASAMGCDTSGDRIAGRLSASRFPSVGDASCRPADDDGSCGISLADRPHASQSRDDRRGCDTSGDRIAGRLSASRFPTTETAARRRPTCAAFVSLVSVMHRAALRMMTGRVAYRWPIDRMLLNPASLAWRCNLRWYQPGVERNEVVDHRGIEKHAVDRPTTCFARSKASFR